MTAPAAWRQVLIVKLSSLGDVIHAMPVVADLRAACPGARIDWVVEPGFAPLVRRVDGVDRVIECAQRRWRKGWWRADVRAEKQAFRARLREVAYDAVFDLQGLTKSALVAWQARLAAGGERIALGNRTDGSGWEAPTRWLAHRAIRLAPQVHAVDRSRQLVAAALGRAVAGSPRYGLQGRVVQATTAGAAPTVVLVHGTSRDDKLWPEASWVEFARRCVAAGWRIALPQAGAQEAARVQRLVTAIGAAQVDAWPAMALDALVDRMAATQGVVGVDSGLSHLAVALDLPHVQLYNFATAWRTGPQPAHGHRHQCSVGGAVQAGVPVAPAVEEVWSAWQQVLAAREETA